MSRRKKDRPQGAQSTSSAPAAVSVQDAFSNPLFRLGYGSQAPMEATDYPLTRMSDNYSLLNSLYRDNWIVQNVVGLVVDDMTREWYKPAGALSPEQEEALQRAERSTQLRERINEGLRWGRLYGGAAGLILIRGQEGMLDKPLDLGSIYPGSFAGLMILDRWCGITPEMELVSDIADPDFNLPAYYQINNAEGQLVARVHHSRILRFTGRELPYLERLAELYWGESEVEALYKDVVAHDNVTANMVGLTFRANINTMEVQNLEQLFSLGSIEQQRRFWAVIQAQSVMASNFGYQMVEKGNQIHNTQYTFSGLKDVYDAVAQNLCGASHYPATKLFGRSPGGLNATGESDLKNYYDYVDSQREAKLRPALTRLLPVLAMSALGEVPADLDIVFPPLWTPTAKETADIAKTKSEAVISAYQSGLLTVGNAQKELKSMAEETGLFGSITDEEIKANEKTTFKQATALQDPLMGYGVENADAAKDESGPRAGTADPAVSESGN